MMTSTYAHPPTIDTSTCPHVAMMHAMMMHHDGVCCGCRWCGWQVSKGRNCDWNGEYAHTQLMICGKCRLQTAHALLHNQPATAAHQPAQLVSTQHSNCKMWTLHPCSLALLGLVLWHLSCGGKLPKLVAHHILCDLQACHAPVTIVHKEHAFQEVWQDDAGPALRLDDCWRRSTLEACLVPPLWVLPCNCYYITQQRNGNVRSFPG